VVERGVAESVASCAAIDVPACINANSATSTAHRLDMMYAL
jgi:hypothetical protein